MTKPIAASYELAQSLISSGAWRVQPDLGLVIGKRGAPFRRMNTNGYIQIKFRHPDNWRRHVAVLGHRVIWEAVHGAVPDYREINHRNGVKLDNRLANLELLTHMQNVRHAITTGLTKALVGEQMPCSLLNDEQALAIYRRAWTGEDQRAIGADFGVGRGIVSNIKRGWAWTHVTHHNVS